MATRGTFEADLKGTAPLGIWRLDEPGGPTAFALVGGNLTYSGSASFAQAGVFSDGPAVHLTGGYAQGSGIYVYHANLAPISMWLKLTNLAAASDQTVIEVGTIAVNGWAIQVSAGSGALKLLRAGIGALALNCSVPDTTWHWWVFGGGSDLGSFGVYRDGQLVGAIPNPTNNASSASVTIGAESDGNLHADAYYSEVTLGNNPIGPQTIAQLYQDYQYAGGSGILPLGDPLTNYLANQLGVVGTIIATILNRALPPIVGTLGVTATHDVTGSGTLALANAGIIVSAQTVPASWGYELGSISVFENRLCDLEFTAMLADGVTPAVLEYVRQNEAVATYMWTQNTPSLLTYDVAPGCEIRIRELGG